MYGLPQAGFLANELLSKRLEKAGYYQCQFTSGLWRHVWRPITFALVVDNFGIKVTGDTHTNHLLKTLRKDYEVTVDWKGELYVGIKLEWDYEKQTLDTHIPGLYQAPSINTNTSAQPSPNMHQQMQHQYIMELRCKRPPRIPHLSSQLNESGRYKKWLVRLRGTHAQLTQPWQLR